MLAPKGVDSSAIVKEFRERFAMVVANGQGEMKGKIFRIAHLGYYDYLDAIGVIGALEHVLAEGRPPTTTSNWALACAPCRRSLPGNSPRWLKYENRHR